LTAEIEFGTHCVQIRQHRSIRTRRVRIGTVVTLYVFIGAGYPSFLGLWQVSFGSENVFSPQVSLTEIVTRTSHKRISETVAVRVGSFNTSDFYTTHRCGLYYVTRRTRVRKYYAVRENPSKTEYARKNRKYFERREGTICFQLRFYTTRTESIKTQKKTQKKKTRRF